MNRRHFIKTAALATTAAFMSGRGVSLAATSTAAPGWRLFETTQRVELAVTTSATRLWLPLPAVEETSWIKTMGNVWQSNAATSVMRREGAYGSLMLAADWVTGEAAPIIEVKSLFATRDRAIDLTQPGKVTPLDAATARLYTRATDFLPTDGIVRKTALEVTQGARNDLDKARAIYDWIVDHTARNPKTRGCGTGDIRGMLETGNLSGKCADLNALYVGMVRALGIPARDVYGIRVADSRLGYKSLGKSGEISKAQHCRAEVWLAGFGWVPVDPADVRKVVLEEQPGLSLDDEIVVAARKRLFGAWEMNWLAFNFAHDLKLPGSKGSKLPFFMYPQGENAGGRFDSLDPDSFRYKITARELTV